MPDEMYLSRPTVTIKTTKQTYEFMVNMPILSDVYFPVCPLEVIT